MMSKAETAKALYDWYKSHGICVKCGQRDAIKGGSRCAECVERDRLWREAHRDQLLAYYRAKSRKWREAHPEYHREYMRTYRAKQKREEAK